MKCFEYYNGFWGGGSLLMILLAIAVTAVLVFLFIHFSQKNKLWNYYVFNRKLCPNCHHPVEETFIRCPVCHFKLKTNCPSCGKVVKTEWDICPYCENEITEKSKIKK